MSDYATAVCIATDAFRICIGMAPKTYSLKQVIRWMRLVSKP